MRMRTRLTEPSTSGQRVSSPAQIIRPLEQIVPVDGTDTLTAIDMIMVTVSERQRWRKISSCASCYHERVKLE